MNQTNKKHPNKQTQTYILIVCNKAKQSKKNTHTHTHKTPLLKPQQNPPKTQANSHANQLFQVLKI